MTAAERVEEYVEEEGEQPEPQHEAVSPQQQVEGESVAEQKEEVVKEEEQCVTVDSVVTVDTVVVQDGKVEEECHEEVNIKQTFTPEEPMPYGPDESLQEDGKVPEAQP
jgi:predicted house-cleaning NTP pyrophosphatase (Maf/HAM1 superfamily)